MIADQDKEKPVTPSLSAAHIVVKKNHHRVKIAHSVCRGRIPSKTLQSDERGIGQHPGTVWGRMDVSDPLRVSLHKAFRILSHYRIPYFWRPQATMFAIIFVSQRIRSFAYYRYITHTRTHQKAIVLVVYRQLLSNDT